MKKLLVIGSINIDLVSSMLRFPEPGETLIGTEFNIFSGGKGANQAVASGKLGSDISFLGKVGDDVFGRQSLEALKAAGVKTDRIKIEKGISTGVASISVAENGENTIVVIPGANAKVDRDYIHENRDIIEISDILLVQLEIPLDTVEYVCKLAREKGKLVILDPAPAHKLSDALISYCDIITPNETEYEILTECFNMDEAMKENKAALLISKGCKAIINKVGKEGAHIYTEKGNHNIKGYLVNAIDTTAAGDSFNAGLAVALSRNKSLSESVSFANAVAALSVTKLGAQSAMPSYNEVIQFIDSFE